MPCSARLQSLAILLSCALLSFPHPLAPQILLPPLEEHQTGAQAQRLVEAGDTSAAMALLDSALTGEKPDCRLLLRRGWLGIELKMAERAREDFSQVLEHGAKEERFRACLGLAETERRVAGDCRRAGDWLNRARRIDADRDELLYARTLLGLTRREPEDFRLAVNALKKLLCRNPEYQEAHRLWREELYGQYPKDRRQVAGCLEQFLQEHPGHPDWQLELAYDDFYLEQPERAAHKLSQLRSAYPDFEPPDLPLLEARLALERGDSLEFVAGYFRALDRAEATGSLGRLERETEAIFLPEDREQWQFLISAEQKITFLRSFWIMLELDPLAGDNRRLTEHYRRLRFAERHYSLYHPQEIFQKELAAAILRAPALAFQDLDPALLFDSEVLVDRCRELSLDHRGLFHLRLGPPTQIERHSSYPSSRVTDHALADTTGTIRLQVWHYGRAQFFFEQRRVTGGYLLYPYTSGEYIFMVGNIESALRVRHLAVEDLEETLDYFVAQFPAPSPDSLEVEIYQAVPEGGQPAPAGELGTFDPLWHRTSQSASRIYRVPAAPQSGDSLWLAVHRAVVPVGRSNYFFRTQVGAKKHVGRGSLNFPIFHGDSINYSAVVLGPLPPEQGPCHERGGVRISPRPWLTFHRGEPIQVYTELGNLAREADGSRSFRQYVDVIRLEEGRGIIRQLLGKMGDLLLSYGQGRAESAIRLVLERHDESGREPVPEVFTLDTAPLEPGGYRLLLEAQDRVSLLWDIEGVEFEIE